MTGVTSNEESPLVGILMGSPSDAEIVNRARATLDQLGVPYEVLVRSAHRTPDETIDYARSARERGVRVIIAAAGMAAHLAGVVAAYTSLPVIGVPIAAGPLAGHDALLSTVQMPPGTPVATVAINGAENAAYLAARILGINDAVLAGRLDEAREERRRRVIQASRPEAPTQGQGPSQ